MIVCGHSKVEVVDGGWKVRIDEKVGSALNLFSGQILFGAGEGASERFFLSPLPLNPHVTYFRAFLEDVRGSLASMTSLFSERGVNLLGGGAFGFGNIWVSEFVADFKDVEATSEDIVNEIEELGGFVDTKEITELFPRAFELKSRYEVRSDSEGKYIVLPRSTGKIAGTSILYAVLKAWPEVQALFIDFISPDKRPMKISAKIKDVPGSLNKLADMLGTQVNLHAIHSQYQGESSGEWTIYGILEIGSIGELEEKAREMALILEFEAEPLGWGGA